MRVQRAPNPADQPQRPPAGIELALPAAAPATFAPGFSADIDLDLTGLLRRLGDESAVVAEVIVRLVAACLQERLIDDESALRVVKPTDEGVVGVELGHAVHLSAYAIWSGLKSLSPELPPPLPRTLTVVHLSGTRVHAVGDWGMGGLGVVTLGRIVPTVVSSQPQSVTGLSITSRRLAHLGFTVPYSAAHWLGVVRALDTVAESVEDWNR
jgi:hypothetical protein